MVGGCFFESPRVIFRVASADAVISPGICGSIAIFSMDLWRGYAILMY